MPVFGLKDFPLMVRKSGGRNDHCRRPSPNSFPIRSTLLPRICTSMNLELAKGLPSALFSEATLFFVATSKMSGVWQ